MCAYYYGWYEVHFHTGRVVEAVKELENYHLFKDSIVNEDNLLAITEEKNKYQLEKKEQEVTRQRDIARRERNTRILSSVVFVALLLALTIFIFWLRARQRTKLAQAELKQQETERNMMIEGQESERKRIAGELHDGLVQELTAIAINLQNDDNIDKGQTIDRVMRVAHEARNIAHQMMPVSLMQLGLINALEDLFQQTYTPLGIGYEFEHFTETTNLSNTVSVSLYRICQELVANSVKHAGATLVHILLRQTPQQIMLVFEDNGKGFDVTLNRTGIGMVSITSRVRYLNGEISFDSDDGAGTTAIVKIPLQAPPAA
jgi:signal transduction histidine kinase